MANEKRLIDANELVKVLDNLKSNLYRWEDYNTGVDSAVYKVENAPTVDAVEVELFNALKSLVNGEWVDCKLVQEALGIDFATGLKMFEFSRTAEWNPAPLNGQKITTKFKLKNAVVHGRWEKRSNHDWGCSVCKKGVPYSFTGFNYCPNCGAKMDGDGNA